MACVVGASKQANWRVPIEKLVKGNKSEVLQELGCTTRSGAKEPPLWVVEITTLTGWKLFHRMRETVTNSR